MVGSEFSLEICRPTETHGRIVFQWRNDPDTQASFFRARPLSWEEFWPDYRDNYFRNPKLPPLFVLKDGKRAAYLGYQIQPHPKGERRVSCDITLNVNPEFRGQGVATAAFMLTGEFLRAAEIDDCFAEIKASNPAVCAALKKAGFVEESKYDKPLGNGIPAVEVIRLRLTITPTPLKSDRVFIIAEAGSNWRMGTAERDFSMGKALIEAAKEAGADAIKFQTYRADTVYVENAGSSDYLKENGIETDIRQIFEDLAMPYELVRRLAEYAKNTGLAFMSTPFSPADFAAVDPHVGIHKIASYEITYGKLIELAARSGKPLLLSTGASHEAEIRWAVDHFRSHGGRDLCLMQCTAKYPAPLSSMNLRVIPWLRTRFQTSVGFSDHSRHPYQAAMAAVALGARVIEKHFTLHNRLPGPDHPFAVDALELKTMVENIRGLEETLGDGKKRILPEEEELAAYAKRGIQAIRPIKKGEALKENQNLAVLRPGKQKLGIHPKFLGEIEGKRSARDIPLGSGIQSGDWEA